MSITSDWINDSQLINIPKEKLIFLQDMLFESKHHSGKELLPFFMSLAMKAKSRKITFSQEEIDVIIPTLKNYAKEDELKKMDQIIKMFYTKK